MTAAYHFAGGDALFTGTLLLLAGLALRCSPRCAHRPALSRILAATGVLFIALSTTPLPPVYYAVWTLTVGLTWNAMRRCEQSPDTTPGNEPFTGSTPKVSRQHRLWTRWLPATAGVSVLCCGHEYRSIVGPRLRNASRVGVAQELHVIGDSLSALGNPPWPEMLAARHGLTAVNHAQPGATVESAVKQAQAITSVRRSLIVIEIGGNDLLAFESASKFESELRQLLQALDDKGNSLVMLELPLLPGFYGYGYAQRRLADEFNVRLISKRELSCVISSDHSADGLHLSQAGHVHLAERLAPYLLPLMAQ